jgi:hypothetical protein
MRRLALLGLLSVLPGCQFAGNPVSGFPGFLADTHNPLNWHPTRPIPVTENEKLAEDVPVKIEPLSPEGGEVWPGPPAPLPTLQDAQKLNNMQQLPPPSVPAIPPPAVFQQNTPAQ